MIQWFKKKNKEYTIFRQEINPVKICINTKPFLPEGFKYKSRQAAQSQLDLENALNLRPKGYESFIIRTK